MTEPFYNPYDTDTEEQMAYQREMLTRYSKRMHPAEHHDAEHETTGGRSLGAEQTAEKAGDDGSEKSKRSFVTMLKDLGDTAKTSMKAVKSYVTLEHKMNKDLSNPQLFPEVTYQAYVRRGLALCQEEQAYLQARKAQARDHFAAYMGWDPAHIHPDDVPTVGFGGSGGGYRAMLAVLGYSRAMKLSGLWPLLSYVAGVSGSCWAIAAYFAFGKCDMDAVIEHCKKRLSPHHPLSPEAVQLVLSQPHGDYQTLGPLIQKHHSGLQNVAMDLYAVFTTGHLFAQEHDPMLHPGGTASSEIPGRQQGWWKWTGAQQYLRNGAEPLPILTAIRHERPWKDWADAEHPFASEDPTTKEHEKAADAWFQWFEMTPYEVGCDEIEAWVPTWGFGRKFEEGHSVAGLPEQSLALLLGLCTSAPAGPLSSYLSTIQRNLPKGFLGNAINSLASGVAKMWGKHETAVFENHHPLHASNEYNFMFHYTPTPQGTPRPPGLENSPRIHLVDSGMDNNCPTYVLLHPNRHVDVILNMDASSDVQKDSFPSRVNQIGARRGLNFTKRHPDLKTHSDDPKDPDRYKGLYAQIYDGRPCPRPEKVQDSYGNTVTNPPAAVVDREVTMVYLPLLPNERAAPGYDPSTAKFSGSYNLVWTPEQVDMIIYTCVANFMDGQDAVREALFNAWQRKKYLREQGGAGAGGQVPGPIAPQQAASQGAGDGSAPGPPPGPPPGSRPV